MLDASNPREPKDDSVWATWNGNDPISSLAELYDATVKRGREHIGWYQRNVRLKRFGSQACRFLAILLFGLAALMPLIKAMGVAEEQSQSPTQGQAQEQQIQGETKGYNPIRVPYELGYVFAALAAGLIAFDKFFGLSTGWIRYIQTQMAIEGALDELHYDWVALMTKTQGVNPAPEQVQAMIQRLRAFVVFVDGQTQQETQAWVMEFQTNLADLEKTAKLRGQEQKPGRIEVTVANARDFDPGVSVSLDGMETRSVEGTSCIFGSVTPGSHIVLVKGSKSGKILQASEIVRVQPDSVGAASLMLPDA